MFEAKTGQRPLATKKPRPHNRSGLLILDVSVSADMKRINGCGLQTVYPFIRYASVDANVENITAPTPTSSALPAPSAGRGGSCWRLKSRQQGREARTLKGIFDLRGLGELE